MIIRVLSTLVFTHGPSLVGIYRFNSFRGGEAIHTSPARVQVRGHYPGLLYQSILSSICYPKQQKAAILNIVPPAH